MATQKENRFCVIGGQYACYDYGCTPTLLGAKRLATKHAEYWDNWQGWHVPAVYKVEDVRLVENFYGTVYAPKPEAQPVALYDNQKERWFTEAELRDWLLLH